jgi:hypothetical protein
MRYGHTRGTATHGQTPSERFINKNKRKPDDYYFTYCLNREQ